MEPSIELKKHIRKASPSSLIISSPCLMQMKWKKKRHQVNSAKLKLHNTLTFVTLGSKLYDWLTVGEFLTHTFHVGNSLVILLSMWVSYSHRQSLGMLAAQYLTMTPETKHSPTKQHRTDNAAYNQCQ